MTDTSDDLFQFRGPRYGVVPSLVFVDKRMKLSARLLLAHLFCYRNNRDEAYPSQEKLAQDIGVDVRTIGRWLKQIEAAGWLTKAKRIHVDPDFKGNPNACIYTIYSDPTGHRGPVRHDTSVRSVRTPVSSEHTNELANEPKVNGIKNVCFKEGCNEVIPDEHTYCPAHFLGRNKAAPPSKNETGITWISQEDIERELSTS